MKTTEATNEPCPVTLQVRILAETDEQAEAGKAMLQAMAASLPGVSVSFLGEGPAPKGDGYLLYGTLSIIVER